MISTAHLTASEAKTYYTNQQDLGRLDYFLKNEGNGAWIGNGIEKLGFEKNDVIDQKDFDNVLLGCDPKTNKQIRQSNGKIQRACTDITFSPSKSLSLAFEFGTKQQQKEILQSWDNAVKTTFDYIENNHSHIREQKVKVRTVEKGSGFIAARFDHNYSRNLDPQLHTHILVMNMIEKDGKFKAWHNNAFFKEKTPLMQIFNSQLAKNLKDYNYNIHITDGKKGDFEIKGIDKKILDNFSSRTKEILDKVNEYKERGIKENLNGAKLLNDAFYATRKAKTKVGKSVIHKHHNAILEKCECSRKNIQKQLEKSKSKQKINEKLNTEDYIRKAINIKLNNGSVFFKSEIIGLASSLSHSKFSLSQLHNTFNNLKNDSKNPVIKLSDNFGGRQIFTTKKMIRLEHNIVKLVNNSKGKYINKISPETVLKAIEDTETEQGYRFTKGQRNLARLLANKDGVNIVQGEAGVGKTSSFKIIKNICYEEEKTCVGISLTGKAVAEMKDAGIDNSFTVDSFLNKINDIKLEKESVILVDESSMIGNYKLNSILNISEDINAKIILVGDKKQLPSISAGRCHDMLWNKTDVRKIKMTEILRQKEGSNAHKIVQKFKSEYIKRSQNNALKISLLEAKKLGKVSQINKVKDRIKVTISKALDNIEKSEKSIILCSKNQSKEKLNKAIRTSLKHNSTISKNDTIFNVMNNVNISSDKSHFADNYKVGQTICFTKNTNNFKKWSEWKVNKIINSEKMLITDKNGEKEIINTKEVGSTLSIFQEKKRNFSIKDKIVFLKNDSNIGVKNGTIGKIVSIRNNGNMSIITDQNNRIKLNISDKKIITSIIF